MNSSGSQLVYTFFIVVFISLGLLAICSPKQSLADDITLENQTQKKFDNFVRDIGVALSYVPTDPAEPKGITGFNIGVEATAVDLPTDNDYMDSGFGGNAPSVLTLPKLHASKGLPLNFDVSGFIAANPGGNARLFGGAIKYAYQSGNVALPAIAFRLHATQLTGVNDLDLRTHGLDVSISKGFTVLTPYAGYSVDKITGEENTPLPLDDVDTNEGRIFGGARFSFGFINWVGEITLGEVTSYSLRANIEI